MIQRALFTLLLALAVVPMSAQTAAYKLNVQNFCELTIVDGIGVDYYCRPDSAGWAVFYCEPDLAGQIMFSNNAESLTVRTAADEKPIAGLPRVKVYSTMLRKVENSGDSLVRVIKPAAVERFSAKQIGNGTLEVYGLEAGQAEASLTAGNGSVRLEGKADKAKLSNVSTGAVDASALLVDNVNCFVFGTGNIDCSPAVHLRVYGAGSGKVLYHCTPDKITNRGIGVKAYAHDRAMSAGVMPQRSLAIE